MKITLPPGSYFIGDIFTNSTIDLNMSIGKLNIDSDTYAVSCYTAYGSGIFLGSDNRYYRTDTGTIGMIPLNYYIGRETNNSEILFGSVYTFRKKVIFYHRNGIFYIISGNILLKIITN